MSQGSKVQQDHINEWKFARITQIRKLSKKVSIKTLNKRFGAALVDQALNTKSQSLY